MARADRTSGAGDARTRALERLDAASAERSRLRYEHESARGTSQELRTDVSLRAADDELAARERWLRWIEEGDY
jgi:hypothetical protein